MTAVETVFELAKEAIEKREACDEDCDREWAAIHQAREDILGERMARSSQPQATQSLCTPDLGISDSAIALVSSDPKSEHRVAIFDANDYAYRHRVKWTQRGYDARTQKIGPHEYAVMVKGNPK